MKKISVTHDPDSSQLNALGVCNWPIWSKEVSTFPWTYDTAETCYLLEGEVVVTPEGGSAVTIQKGDLVTFPEGMNCTWEILKPVRKYYKFD